MNDENLKKGTPFKKGDGRASAAGKIGGKKSGEVRRKRREMRETLEIMLNMPLDKGAFKDIENECGLQVHGLLGTDFLMGNKCIIDFKNKRICIRITKDVYG